LKRSRPEVLTIYIEQQTSREIQIIGIQVKHLANDSCFNVSFTLVLYQQNKPELFSFGRTLPYDNQGKSVKWLAQDLKKLVEVTEQLCIHDTTLKVFL